ncbi:MAG: hypothetical protein KAT28_02465 [Candidatus Aenigmarchaeota archaeon]|nr:hypothetical protein [Candidatus Aenigmarchaeota archaeon]
MVGFDAIFAIAGGGGLTYEKSKYQIEEDNALEAYYRSVEKLYESGITKDMFEAHRIMKKSGSGSGVKLLEDLMKKEGVNCSDLLEDYYKKRAKVEHLRVDEIFLFDSYNPHINKYLT